jgi:hypothetical protein
MGPREDLLRRESEGWETIDRVLAGLGQDELTRPGLTEDGWSVKDLLGHLAFWCEEAARVLVEIPDGSRDGADAGLEPGQIDAMNREAVDRMRAADLGAVRTAWHEGRSRMLGAFGALAVVSPEAAEWFDESGPAHYAEHLPELERWTARARSGG